MKKRERYKELERKKQEEQLEELFLKESNAIEGEFSQKALEDSKRAWKFTKRYSGQMNIYFICQIHKRLMKRLNPEIAGKIRDCDIWVGNRKGINPENIREELRLLCNKGLYPDYTEEQIKTFHIQFEKIHPFRDGNGRTGRIILNWQRLKIELPLLLIHDRAKEDYYRWFKNG